MAVRVYFFLLAATFALVACCAVMSACFFLFTSFDFDCFCDAFFCTDLGDLSPMTVLWFEVYPPSECLFLRTWRTLSRTIPREAS